MDGNYITNITNCRLISLNNNLIQKIFSYLERKDFIKVVLLSKKLKKLFKYKIRHLKILKFLTLYFFKTTSTLQLFNYLYSGDNYKHIQEKFKILPEKDLLKGLSLFLEYLQEQLTLQNINDNIFFIKFDTTISLEFMSKFILIHPYKQMISTIVVDKYFSNEFIKQISIINKIYLNENSKNISKFFDPKNHNFRLNLLNMDFCNNVVSHFHQIKAYFFNHKNHLNKIEIEDPLNNNLNPNNEREVDSFIDLIEYNSEAIFELKLNLGMKSFERFFKILSRCRNLKVFHLNLEDSSIQRLLKSTTIEELCVVCLQFCKIVEEISINPEILLKFIKLREMLVTEYKILKKFIMTVGITSDPKVSTLITAFDHIKEFDINLDITTEKEMTTQQVNFIESIGEAIKNHSLVEELNLKLTINHEPSSLKKDLISLNNVADDYFESAILLLMGHIKLNKSLKVIKIDMQQNVSPNFLNHFYSVITSLVKNNQNLKIVQIKIKNNFENLSLLTPNICLQTLGLDNDLLYLFKELVIRNIDAISSSNIEINTELDIFVNFFSKFENQIFLDKIKSVTFHNKSCNMEKAYLLRDIISKLDNLEEFVFKDFSVKYNLFDIICDSFHNLTKLKSLKFSEIEGLEEKTLLKILNTLNTNNLAFLQLYYINAGDLTMEFLSKNKAKFKCLVSLDFQVTKSFVKGMEYFESFLFKNYLIFEIYLRLCNFPDIQRLNKVMETYKFISFDVDPRLYRKIK